jgi:4,5-DOPA dioxygenase extradiol
VHNLGLIQWNEPESAFDWARSFNEAAISTMNETPGAAAGLQHHEHFRLAAPTPDHFIPLLYIAGLADAAGHGTEVLIDGYAMGSLSMTAFTVS